MRKHDIDEIITLLENPTRRKILRLLAQENHYPLQIARELGLSQQAVGKHIKILEDHGLIRSHGEPSQRGGPPRKSYVPTRRISFRVDLGPGIFQTYYFEKRQSKQRIPSRTEVPQPGSENVDNLLSKSARGKTGPENDHDKGGRGSGGYPAREERVHRLRTISGEIRTVDKELKELEDRRISLLSERSDLMQEGKASVRRMIPDYMERKLIYYLLDRGPTPIEDLSELFDRRIKILRTLQHDLEDTYGLMWLFRGDNVK
jgi:ArsR family transcriptional regulator